MCSKVVHSSSITLLYVNLVHIPLIQPNIFSNNLSTIIVLMWQVSPKLSFKVKVAQSWLTFCDLMDRSLLGSSVYGILQARIPEWVACSLPQEIFPTQSSFKDK